MKCSVHETVRRVISLYFCLQFARCRKWRVWDTWHDSNMWLVAFCATDFWVHFNIWQSHPPWTRFGAREASTRLYERSAVKVVSPQWGVNVVTAPSQHAAAIVWWGRCSPFKLCLSPPVGHSLCYLHFWVTVGFRHFGIQNGEVYLHQSHAPPPKKKNSCLSQNSQIIYYKSCPHRSCCSKKYY